MFAPVPVLCLTGEAQKETELTESQELTLDELIEEFEFLGDWEDQCRYLIELGEQLPDLAESEKAEVNRVLGCQSRVWLVLESRSDAQHIWFRAKSDSRLVDGLIVIVSLLFNGKSAEEILATDFRPPFKQLGLESHLVPQRRNGLFAMVERVRSLAKAIAAGEALAERLPAETCEPADTTPSAADEIKRGTAPASAAASPGADLAASRSTEVRVRPANHQFASKHAAAQQESARGAPTGEGQFAGQEATSLWDVEAVRAQFPALQHVNSAGRPIVFLDSAASAQKPQRVIDKETEVYEQYYANAYRGVYRFGDRVSRELEMVRQRIADHIGAESPELVFFTTGTTMGMNLIANAWGRKFLRKGDEILLTLAEHHANIVPWQWVAQQTGATVRFAPLTGDGELDLNAFDAMVTPRTRVISVSGVSNVLGTITPLAHLGEAAKKVGAILVVDGAQSVPHVPIHVVREHVDFLAFSAHKLYGPSGVGACYGRRALLESMDPFLCGGHMISSVDVNGFQTAPVPAKFEAGTLPIAQAIALGTAIEFVQQLTPEAIHAHEQQLLAYAQDRMATVPGMRMYGPRHTNRAAIIPFTVEGAAAQDVASLLDVYGVCVRHGHHCTMPLHDWLGVPATIRASFALYNTKADVDALVEGLHSARDVLKLS